MGFGHLLNSASERTARPERKLHRVWNTVMTSDLEVQFERALLLDHCNLLVQGLDIAHLPTREIELAPEPAILSRRECVVSLGIAQVFGQWLIVRNVVALVEDVAR